MRKNMPKLMSIVLIFMLLAGALPQNISPKPVSAAGTISVSTGEELWYALSTAESGTTVQLANNIIYDLYNSSMVSSAVILDFNGFKITSYWTLFRISQSGKLTLINAQIDAYDYLIEYNYGELIINSTYSTGLVLYYYLSYENIGIITFNDGKFTFPEGYGFYSNHGDININGGQFICNTPYCYYIIEQNYGNTNVTGGNLAFEYGGFILSNYGGNVTISNGTIATGESFISESTGGTIKIENASINSQAFGLNNLSDTNVIIKNSTITSVDNVILNSGNSVVNIYAGTFTTNATSCLNPNVINTTGSVGLITLYGGTYTTQCSGASALVDPVPQDIVIPTGYTATPADWRTTTAPTVTIAASAIPVKVTFIDGETTTQETVPVGTYLKDVPGFADRYGKDQFYAWKLGEVLLPADTSQMVNADITLTAVYSETVTTPAGLQAALTAKKPSIILGDNIPVTATVIINYDCTISSTGNFKLVRDSGFTGTLLEVATDIACTAPPAPAPLAGPTLTLENVTVDGNKAAVSALAPTVWVNQNTTLVLKGATVKDNFINPSNTINGGGIHNVGTLRMYEGSMISGNQAEKGGGVYNSSQAVCAPVTFHMYGGEISGNIATDSSPAGANNGGGGVNVDNDAVFTMHNGKIKGNSAPYSSGGGVSLGEGETTSAFLSFYLYGGEITDNTAKNYGGGVYLGGDAMEMDGGLISRNTAASGGGISAKPLVGKPNLLMYGGLITLNAARWSAPTAGWK